MRRKKVYRTIGLTLLLVGAGLGIGALIMRDQISRHKRNLFSAHAFRRFAALSYMARLDASIDLVHTLRDFVAREPRALLRNRGRQILDRMEGALERNHSYMRHAGHGEFAG